jgi:hypothetical protein
MPSTRTGCNFLAQPANSGAPWGKAGRIVVAPVRAARTVGAQLRGQGENGKRYRRHFTDEPLGAISPVFILTDPGIPIPSCLRISTRLQHRCNPGRREHVLTHLFPSNLLISEAD